MEAQGCDRTAVLLQQFCSSSAAVWRDGQRRTLDTGPLFHVLEGRGPGPTDFGKFCWTQWVTSASRLSDKDHFNAWVRRREHREWKLGGAEVIEALGVWVASI